MVGVPTSSAENDSLDHCESIGGRVRRIKKGIMIMRRFTGFYTLGEKATVTRNDLVSHPIIRLDRHPSYHVILTYVDP